MSSDALPTLPDFWGFGRLATTLLDFVIDMQKELRG